MPVQTIALFDTVTDSADAPVANATVTLTFGYNSGTTADGLLQPSIKTVQTDGTGKFTFAKVIPNDLISPANTVYMIETPFRVYEVAPQSGNGASQQSTAANVIVNNPLALAPYTLIGPVSVTGTLAVTGALTVVSNTGMQVDALGNVSARSFTASAGSGPYTPGAAASRLNASEGPHIFDGLARYDLLASEFGGLWDARYVFDAAITSGAAILTSATAAFTSADVGKSVAVLNASTSLPALVTTIASVTNATTAVLAANATATTSADAAVIGTDQTAALNKLIDKLNLGVKGVGYLPAGAGLFTGTVHTLNLMSGSLEGPGAAACGIIYCGNADWWRIQAVPFLSQVDTPGPATGVSGSRFKGVTIDGTFAGPGAVGLHYGEVPRGRLEDLQIQNFTGGTPTANTLLAPTLLAVAGATGFHTGSFTVAYSYVTATGETAPLSGTTVALTAGQGIQVSAINNIPSTVTQIKYYLMAVPAGDTTGLSGAAVNVVNRSVPQLTLTAEGTTAARQLSSTGGIGMLWDNVTYWTERTRLDQVSLSNNTIGWKLQSTAGAQARSFGYTKAMDVLFEINSGQTGIYGVSPAGASATWYNSIIHVQANKAGSCVLFNFDEPDGSHGANNTFFFFDNLVDIVDEGNLPTPGQTQTLVTVGTSAVWRAFGIMIPGGTAGQSLMAMTGDIAGVYFGLVAGDAVPGPLDASALTIQAHSGGSNRGELRLAVGQSWVAKLSQDTNSNFHINNGGIDGFSLDAFGHIGTSLTAVPVSSALGANVTSVTATAFSNDNIGALTVVMSAGLAANTRIATLTFGQTFGANAPRIRLTDETSGAGLARVTPYVQAQATGVSFDIACNQALVAGTYTFGYFVLGRF